MRPGEWLVLAVAGSIGGFFGVSFLLGWLLGIAAGVLAAFGFWMWLDYMAGKLQKAFAEDLPASDVQMLAIYLRQQRFAAPETGPLPELEPKEAKDEASDE